MSTTSKQNPCYNDHTPESPKDHVEELLLAWTTYSKSLSTNNSTLLGIAAQICLLLSKRNSFDALEIFLERLPEIPEYSKHQDVLRAKISLALHKKQADIVLDIIKNNFFEENDDIIKAWDEANYIEEEERLQKSLTPLARFRVRKRHPPPPTVCPSGVRKTASLPKGATKILREWLLDHFSDPYPSGEEKMALAKVSDLTPNQVKTWFANARRRIHKGADSMIAKQNQPTYGLKTGYEDKEYDVLRRSVSAEGGSYMLPTDMNSLFPQNGLANEGRRAFDGNECEKPALQGFRCVHAVHNAYACLHCQSHAPQSNFLMDEHILNAARFGSHAAASAAAAGNFGMHPAAGYVRSHWPYVQPAQHRYDDFDGWYRNLNYQPVGQERVVLEPTGGISSRLEVENNLTTMALMNPYLQNAGLTQAKLQVTTPVAPLKDELTEVGAARILADLSSKQNWSLPYPVHSTQCQIE